jgi:hypothetical protein
MRIRLIGVLLPLLLVGAATPRDGDDTPLMAEMEKLEAAMEFLKRSVRDAAQDERSLEQLVIAQQACLASKQMTPKMAAQAPAAEQPKLVREYRKAMAATLADLAQLETALLDGDREKARALWKQLDERKDEGHNTFTVGE